MNEKPEKGKIIKLIPNDQSGSNSTGHEKGISPAQSSQLPEGLERQVTLDNYMTYVESDMPTDQKLKILETMAERVRPRYRKEIVEQIMKIEKNPDKLRAWELLYRTLSTS